MTVAKKIRPGKFRKILISEEQLQEEAAPMFDRLSPLIELWQSGQLEDAPMACLYILAYLQHRKPQQWLQGPLSLPLVEEEFRASPYHLFGRYALRSIPLSVNKVMVKWCEGKWPLLLLTRVPSPEEVLELQAQGLRCVTMIIEKKGLGKYVIGERDPLGFLLHDLIHAERFYRDPLIYQGQVGFYRLLWRMKQKLPHLSEMMANDSVFAEEFEYIMSDMNAYCGHLFLSFKAITHHYFLRQGGPEAEKNFFNHLFDLWEIKGAVRDAAMRASTESFNQEKDLPLLQNFCEMTATTNPFPTSARFLYGDALRSNF